MEIGEPVVTHERPLTKHSGLGIASFVIAIAMFVLEFVLIAVAGVLEVTTPGGIDEKSAAAILLGLGVLGGLFVDMFAIGLGIAGLCQRDVKKLIGVVWLWLLAP
jgi:hypothetical protein